MGEVVDGNFVTKLDLPVERVLEKASDRGLESVVILGYDSDGEEYFASSLADGGTVLWLMERAKVKLLAITDEMS